MQTCNLISKCSYINETVRYEKSYTDVMKSNFCKFYFKSCAIWEIAEKNGLDNVPKNLLPFQHRIVKRVL